MNIQKMLDQMNNAVRIGLGPDAGQVKEWLHAIEAAMKNPVAWRFHLEGSPVVTVYAPPESENWTPLYEFPPDDAENERLKADLETAERALDAQTDFRAEIQRLEAEIALLRTGDT